MYRFTSESVSIGHPDKLADQISDAVLDEALRQDPTSKVACETLVSQGLVVIAGEISSKAELHFSDIARKTIMQAGYQTPESGFDAASCGIVSAINKQSPDISRVLDAKQNPFKKQGAGDQGIMFGYATNETKEFMPLPILLANKLVLELKRRRENAFYPFLRPDAKTQVTVEYDEHFIPKRIHCIVLSTQHTENVSQDDLIHQMKSLICETIPAQYIDDKTQFLINPSGRFVLGGPSADTGLTGRKQIVDTYGSAARHGGGAFSGKDPSKVDRSACYMARYIAKNIVAAGLCSRCELQFAYAIGIPYPVALLLRTFQTGKVSEKELENAIPEVFDLSPEGIIQTLDLLRPIYRKTAFGGHFGRSDPDFTWEKTDKISDLKKAVKFSS